MIVGTCAKAVRKAASERLAKALIPARNNSLFFAGRVSLVARCLSASSTTYSAFGMVKLSRTNFGFLALTAFLSFASGSALVAAGLTATFLTTVFLTDGVFASGDFVATGLLVAVFFYAGWMALTPTGFTIDLMTGLAAGLAAGLATIFFPVSSTTPALGMATLGIATRAVFVAVFGVVDMNDFLK